MVLVPFGDELLELAGVDANRRTRAAAQRDGEEFAAVDWAARLSMRRRVALRVAVGRFRGARLALRVYRGACGRLLGVEARLAASGGAKRARSSWSRSQAASSMIGYVAGLLARVAVR
jgi:hypothetical protein